MKSDNNENKTLMENQGFYYIYFIITIIFYINKIIYFYNKIGVI